MSTDYTTKDNLWITDWANPTTGETRYYLNDWEEDVAGVEVYRRKSGSISEFYIRDEKIANNRHGHFGGKVWVSETGDIHVELSRAYYETRGVDGEAIEADLREAARQLWEAKYAPVTENTEEKDPAMTTDLTPAAQKDLIREQLGTGAFGYLMIDWTTPDAASHDYRSRLPKMVALAQQVAAGAATLTAEITACNIDYAQDGWPEDKRDEITIRVGEEIIALLAPGSGADDYDAVIREAGIAPCTWI